MTRRVLHYVDADLFGGSEEAALQLLGSLDRARWQPVLLHHPEPGLARLVEGAARLGIRTLAVPRVDPRARIAGVLRLRRMIRAERPAVFHAHLSWPLACKHGVLAAWLARVPAIVGTAQLYVEPRDLRRARLALRLMDRIIAVSREVRTRYVGALGVSARKLAVVPNGIAIPSVVPPADPALRAELVRGRPDYVVLTPARLHEQKGHAFLLEAAAQVPDATFVLAGDGPLRASLMARARELGVAERCVFLGHRSDVAELLAVADLFVLPSLYEGLPVSVLEAMAARRPVVATAIGGTDEAVSHEVTGLLVPPSDSDALASAIRRMRSDPAFAARLAAAGRERVEREFSSLATAGGVVRIYDEILGLARDADGSLANLTEREANARLRRVDWRFLLPAPRPRLAFCQAGAAMTEAVTSVAAEVTTAPGARDCDLSVGEDPDGSTLAELFGALRPGGACYTEWRSLVVGARRVEQALRAAGFSHVSCYRPWPSAAPLYWIPLGAPGAAAYVRSRRLLRGGRVRRFLASFSQRARGLLRGRNAAPICAVAFRPADVESSALDLTSWLREGWSDWGLGASPERLSLLLATGGPRSVSKAVILGFAEPGPSPQIAIKAPRVDAAAEGIRREGTVLETLGERRPISGIPRLLFRRELAGIPVVGESALTGLPLEKQLGAGSLRTWSGRVTDWLAAFAAGAPERPAAYWRETIVEPTLARFREQFGQVADGGLLRASERIAREIRALPAVPEQRDFGPWNLLVTPDGGLGVLDWESAEADGLPLLDLLYFLAYASFNADGAHDRNARLASYRRSLDASTPTGAVRRECVARYMDLLGLESGALGPLRVLLWMIHAPSDFQHAAADAGGVPPESALERSLFFALWAEEVRHTAGP